MNPEDRRQGTPPGEDDGSGQGSQFPPVYLVGVKEQPPRSAGLWGAAALLALLNIVLFSLILFGTGKAVDAPLPTPSPARGAARP